MLTKHEAAVVKDAVTNGLDQQEILFILALNRVAMQNSGLVGFTAQHYIDVKKDVAAFQSQV